MADSIVRLTVNSQEYDQKLKRAAEGLTRYADECRKVGGTLEVVEKDTLDYVRAIGQMENMSRTATGKLAEMKKTFTELSVQYKQLTNEEKQSPFGKALAQSLDQLKVRINDNKAQLDDVNKSLNCGGGLKDALDQVAGKFGLNITQVTKFGSVVGIATTAIQVAKDAFFQSESGIDSWGRTVEGAKGAYNVFLDTLNNGNWSDFFSNLEKAIQGGRDLYDVFDRLGSIKSNNAAAIAIVQQEIAQLRLAKQQGENVDAQLKEATERLAHLQKQSIDAGKAAGNKSAFEVIRNGVNSIGGAGVNDATIKLVVDRIIKNGQGEFDKYKYNYETLRKRGTRTTVMELDDGYGGTINKYSQTFDINLLTNEQQKQYAIAKAVTEGETRIQKGIAAYAQAVQEGTASAREQFKGNRYALQGSGNGTTGGGRSGSGSTKTVQTELQQNQAEINRLTQEYVRLGDMSTQSAEDRKAAIQDEIEKLKERNGLLQKYAAQAEGRQLLTGSDISTKGLGNFSETMNPFAADNMQMATGGVLKLKLDDKFIEDFNRTMVEAMNKKNDRDVFDDSKKLVSGLNQVAGGLQQMGVKLPTEVQQVIGVINGAMTVIEGVNTVLSLFGSSILTANTMAITANTAALWAVAATNIIPGFAGGGIVPHAASGYMVPGTHFSGDVTPIMANAGELVLNRAQVGNLASQLQNTGMGPMSFTLKAAGEQLIAVIDRTGKRKGMGELMWWK